MKTSSLTLAVLIGLTGANAFAQTVAVPEPVLVRAAPSREYAEAIGKFNAYRAGKRKGIKNDANLPFMMERGEKSRRSILLVHGLTDSPYYMTALGDIFYARGYNVVSVLLRGHGTKPEDLHRVYLKNWRDDVKLGLDIARELGDEVSIAGFSTGGALALDAVADNFSGRGDGGRFGDMYLFSPAIEVLIPAEKVKMVKAGCIAPDLTRTFVQEWARPPYKTESDPARYSNMSINGLCQLLTLAERNRLNHGRIMTALKGHGVFTVQSMADQTVSAPAVERFMSGLPAGDHVFVALAADRGIQHGDVTLPGAENPAFGEIESALSTFINRRNAASGEGLANRGPRPTHDNPVFRALREGGASPF